MLILNILEFTGALLIWILTGLRGSLNERSDKQRIFNIAVGSVIMLGALLLIEYYYF